MLAFMKYENGLNFKKVIFENENAAKLWLKQNGIVNPNCYELVEVEFVKEDLKALKKIELEEELQRVKESVEWFQKMCIRYENDKIFVDKLNECIAECEKIQKEIDNL